MSYKKSYCPVCYGELEVIDVAPCDGCGSDPEELRHFAEGKHTYSEYAVYGSEMVLCNFCDADFSSYDPKFWGRPERKSVGLGTEGFQWLRDIPKEELVISKGKFCRACGRRSTFLNALVQARTGS